MYVPMFNCEIKDKRRDAHHDEMTVWTQKICFACVLMRRSAWYCAGLCTIIINIDYQFRMAEKWGVYDPSSTWTNVRWQPGQSIKILSLFYRVFPFLSCLFSSPLMKDERINQVASCKWGGCWWPHPGMCLFCSQSSVYKNLWSMLFSLCYSVEMNMV